MLPKLHTCDVLSYVQEACGGTTVRKKKETLVNLFARRIDVSAESISLV